MGTCDLHIRRTVDLHTFPLVQVEGTPSPFNVLAAIHDQSPQAALGGYADKLCVPSTVVNNGVLCGPAFKSAGGNRGIRWQCPAIHSFQVKTYGISSAGRHLRVDNRDRVAAVLDAESSISKGDGRR